MLHIAAAENKKKRLQDILKYYHEEYKDNILKHKDDIDYTLLYLLISQGCFILELEKNEGLDIMVKKQEKSDSWHAVF